MVALLSSPDFYWAPQCLSLVAAEQIALPGNLPEAWQGKPIHIETPAHGAPTATVMERQR